MNTQKSVKLSLILTNIFILLLVIITIALPWMVYWYVETMKRSASLPATILVTCYPCAPFVAAALISLRKLLKNALKNEIFVLSNIRHINVMSVCCLVIAIITLIAGRFYLPFYIVGATFAFLALLTFSIKNIFASTIPVLAENEESKDTVSAELSEKSDEVIAKQAD